ncbi:hypothetical protein [Lutibacter flavus]|uniref:hypothetical protein n=1 Tax=Lutibacter flavus TaxID=691689 RepID=UPI0011324A85|nr:hypothetical protein [Lutibacter flavus]
MLIVCLTFLSNIIIGQNKTVEKKITITAEQAQIINENEIAVKEWIEQLQTPGVIVSGDQMIFSKEAMRLINEPNYRSEVYKELYTYEDVKESLSKSEFQKAVWQLLNIYPANKEHILQYIYAYDKVIPSDKLVVGAFYTYAFFDPKITTIENGKPNIYRPDIFEDYLRRTKEIVGYIAYFREQEKKIQVPKKE